MLLWLAASFDNSTEGPSSTFLFHKEGTEAEKGTVIVPGDSSLIPASPSCLQVPRKSEDPGYPIIQSPHPHTPSRGCGLTLLQL